MDTRGSAAPRPGRKPLDYGCPPRSWPCAAASTPQEEPAIASSPRTYFLDRLPPGELARILLGRKRFFLENVGDMDETVAAIEAHCRDHGLSSRVCKHPYNPALSAQDALLLIPSWIGMIAATALSALALRGPRADLLITLRSNSLLEIRYCARGART